jgi:membrane protease YdiL (CAAX protease family)
VLFLVLTVATGAAATATQFPLAGTADRAGLVVGTIGSCVVFAVGHEQYPIALRVVVGVVAVVFAYPWIAARSLWASWIPHTLGDFIGDTIDSPTLTRANLPLCRLTCANRDRLLNPR